MKNFYLYILLLLLSIGFNAYGQEEELEKYLRQDVENINPVYKPVVGFGTGVFGYFGDLSNKTASSLLGTPGIHLNVATYADNKHFFRANFYFIYGKLVGEKRSIYDLTQNFNFQTDLYVFGLNINYDFDHFYKKRYGVIQPFVSLGIETILFNSKTDLFGSYKDPETGRIITNAPYYHWSDGTIRNLPEAPENQVRSVLMRRDYIYETSVKDINWGLGDYNQYTFAIPFEFGFDFHLSQRLTFRIANSLHFTLTDKIDHVSYKNKSGIIGDKKLDWFNFAYVSIHLDLFSSKKVITLERFFRDVDYDYSVLYGDEDGDGVFDAWDNCPGTPPGVLVDTTGCPLDSDGDGVPDYIDEEPNTRKGAIVNQKGVEVTEEDLIKLLDKSMAVGRNEVDIYLMTPEKYVGKRPKKDRIVIPEKFKSVDIDKDGYISFDEMLKAIDDYFDNKSKFTASDIYELNSFFFSQ